MPKTAIRISLLTADNKQPVRGPRHQSKKLQPSPRAKTTRENPTKGNKRGFESLTKSEPKEKGSPEEISRQDQGLAPKQASSDASLNSVDDALKNSAGDAFINSPSDGRPSPLDHRQGAKNLRKISLVANSFKAPAYTLAAERAGYEGRIAVKVRLNSEGHPTAVHFQPKPRFGMQQPLEQAFRQARYLGVSKKSGGVFETEIILVLE